MSRLSPKKWLSLLLGCIGALLLALAMFNWAIDPWWCFGHKRWFTPMQMPFNERSQKTNYLTFVNRHQYDALIIGNSHSSLINQNEFRGAHPYNYSMAALTPYEYKGYLDYFKKTNGAPRVIFMGLDFDNSNEKLQYSAEHPEYYINNAQSWLYRYRTLLSYDTFDRSRQNLDMKRWVNHNKAYGGAIIYDNHNVATLIKPRDPVKQHEFVSKEVADFRAKYRNSYRYREDLSDSLRQLIRENPESRFVAFTTPVSKLFYCAMVNEGRLPEYERWLREMVSVYGEVWNFQYLNSVTNDYTGNYSDSHHFYAPVGTLVAHKITGVADPRIPADFGVLVNKDNIDAHLAKIRSESGACREVASF